MVSSRQLSCFGPLWGLRCPMSQWYLNTFWIILVQGRDQEKETHQTPSKLDKIKKSLLLYRAEVFTETDLAACFKMSTFRQYCPFNLPWHPCGNLGVAEMSMLEHVLGNVYTWCFTAGQWPDSQGFSIALDELKKCALGYSPLVLYYTLWRKIRRR